jgi:nitrite reductase (NADH) small subunit
MTAWVEAGSLQELQRRKKLLVDVGGRGVVLVLGAEGVRAIDNICIHRERELVRGTLLGNRIVCPGHQWAFDLDTGYEQKMCRYQPTFDVRVEDDRIFVSDEPRPLPSESAAHDAVADGPAA